MTNNPFNIEEVMERMNQWMKEPEQYRGMIAQSFNSIIEQVEAQQHRIEELERERNRLQKDLWTSDKYQESIAKERNELQKFKEDAERMREAIVTSKRMGERENTFCTHAARYRIFDPLDDALFQLQANYSPDNNV